MTAQFFVVRRIAHDVFPRESDDSLSTVVADLGFVKRLGSTRTYGRPAPHFILTPVRRRIDRMVSPARQRIYLEPALFDNADSRRDDISLLLRGCLICE